MHAYYTFLRSFKWFYFRFAIMRRISTHHRHRLHWARSLTHSRYTSLSRVFSVRTEYYKVEQSSVASRFVSAAQHTHTLAVTQNAIQFVFGNRISVNIIFGQTKFYNGIRVQNHQAFTFARHQALISLSRTHIYIYTRNGHQTHSRWEHITTCRISVRNKRGKRTVEVKPKSFEAQSELVAGQTKINF